MLISEAISESPDQAERMSGHITKTRLFKYIENFTTKNWKIVQAKILIFFMFLLKT